MSALRDLLKAYYEASKTEREKGTYFEELCRTYFHHEPKYADLYDGAWLWADWVKEFGAKWGFNAKDTGIDLVTRTRGTQEFHAVQAKFFGADHSLAKSDIDSFFTASGKKPFVRRLIVATTNKWSSNAEAALSNQQPPVTVINLADLEDSLIDWAKYGPRKQVVLKSGKVLRPHQEHAVKNVVAGLGKADRGKLIMACGTGKTFTALRIAEALAGKGGRVLFLVPSLNLLSQTLTEWTHDAKVPMHSFAVCSDSDVGKKRDADEDAVHTIVHELQYPATTDAAKLAAEVKVRADAKAMTVVFSTYHSIDVLHEAQQQHKLAAFDLVICDEAHRTTGATFDDESESAFVRVHDGDYIQASKRLYMTATPRIYGEGAKATAEKDNTALCSMDDPALYGDTLHVVTFSEAVQRGLLTDYKVVVLAIDEDHINRRLQKLLSDANNQLRVDDAAKIVGCWKALSKQGKSGEPGFDDTEPMRRALAFCQVIEPSTGKKHHKVSSKFIAKVFQQVVEAYQEQEPEHNSLVCKAEHVDGGMNAGQKEEKLRWLRAAPDEDTCHILSNVRCLSEGVDVPALDAVLFLTPRNSQVDVVQSVGRVMRNAPGKKRGYVVLPVVIPAGMTPEEALDDNKTYRVVWQVLQALRSHDDHFDALINKLDLIGSDPRKMEVIAVTDKVVRRSKGKSAPGKGGNAIGAEVPEKPPGKDTQRLMQFNPGVIEKALYAKVVQKCGNRHHWEDWANDIAKIANTHINRISTIVANKANKKEAAAFQAFAGELRTDLNDSITDSEVIEMLAQHMVTRPVFEALFAGYSFADHNPVSKAMQNVLDLLHEHGLSKEAETLDKFYASVKMRAEGIDNAQGKQKIIVELYDKFFRNAFPKMTERLGIVYTPVEVVDFIIHSVNDVLQEEFGQTLGSKGVHIIDPFTGTGTFITRMLQSGLIKPEELPHKYKHEIHANEIVLLAYYIAAINIEAAYHGLVGGKYQPFEGICLTDTFQLYEKEGVLGQLMVDNSGRRKRQKKLDIRVIMANPPYSAGQKSANDANANLKYPSLDSRIEATYALHSSTTLQNSLYDSYIRAIRWASDRIGKSGVIGYVTNAGWIDGNATDGMRKCLAEEFSNIYVFHLRGNQRTSGELSRREGGKIFGSGSRAPIAITLLVKNPANPKQGQIFFHDIGDYLTQEQKLEKIAAYKSFEGIGTAEGWQFISPDSSHDWINQADDSFNRYVVLGKKGNTGESTVFCVHSSGVSTGRDAWCYNDSHDKLLQNMDRMIANYLDEAKRVSIHGGTLTTDASRVSWTRSLRRDAERGTAHVFRKGAAVPSDYRPFNRRWLYLDRTFNDFVGKAAETGLVTRQVNRLICVTGVGSRVFSALMTGALPCRDMIEKGQCFPLSLFDQAKSAQGNGKLFSGNVGSQDGITDAGLKHFQAAYPGLKITKEDLFYYVYGLLHSPDYRERFANNLSKQLPRIPAVKKAEDFLAFSKAGRELGELHVGYESVKPYPATLETSGKHLTDEHYYVRCMKFGGKGKQKDKTTIIYNEHITVKGIPLDAYDYVVNSKPAIEWVMDRQCVSTDKASGIVNDANDYAKETVGDAKYPLMLLLRVITVSLETNRIVKALPKLDI